MLDYILSTIGQLLLHFTIVVGFVLVVAVIAAAAWLLWLMAHEALVARGVLRQNRRWWQGYTAGLSSIGPASSWFSEDPATADLLLALANGGSVCAARADWRRARNISKMYFEAHVTTDPIPATHAAAFRVITQECGFHIASLLMEKPGEGLVSHDADAFCTGRGPDFEDLKSRTHDLCLKLVQVGIVVRRYKIEDTLLDSRVANTLHGVVLRDPKAPVKVTIGDVLVTSAP